MIDTQIEALHRLSTAAGLVPSPSGCGVNVSTVWRWAKRGVRGIRLETIMIGGIRYTSVEALQRFFAATTAVSDGLAPATTRSRMARIAAAELELSPDRT